MKRKFSDYTHEELLKLSDDELSMLFDNERVDENLLLQKFKNETYPNMSFSEKAGYWSGRFHQQMRWQGESGLDEYAIFSPEWYESTLKFEPDFDKIMDEVFEKYLGTVWSKYEFLKRIGKIK